MFFSKFPYYVIYSSCAKSFLAKRSIDVALPSDASKFKSLDEAKKAASDPFYNSFGEDYIIYRIDGLSKNVFDMTQVYPSN